jgi:hypothetical protein
MAERSQPAEKSILLSRPTNAFYGIYVAIQQRHAFYIITCLMAILSEFLPILLTNIPYNLAQTLESHDVCTYLSLGILSIMILTLAGSFFMRWPAMPVDPRTVAGALWYVCESRMLDDFDGMALLNARDRERRVKQLGKRYYYGGLLTAPGGASSGRMGVDADLGPSDQVVTAYLGNSGDGRDLPRVWGNPPR